MKSVDDVSVGECQGMAHLELKQIVHRDLAARNVLGTCCHVNLSVLLYYDSVLLRFLCVCLLLHLEHKTRISVHPKTH